MENCDFFINSFTYYTHIPIIIIGVFFVFYILSKDFKNPINKSLSLFIILFIFWAINDLFQWITRDYDLNLFFTKISIIESLGILFFLYFSYYFVGEELKKGKKFILFLPFLPILLLIFSDYNITNFDGCDPQYGSLYIYMYLLVIAYTFFSGIKLFSHYRNKKTDAKKKKQIMVVLTALIFLVIWFLVLTEISNMVLLFYKNAIVYQFTPFGFLIFIGLLIYAVTKYQLFEIKLIGAQVLVVILIALIGSQFFFINYSNITVVVLVCVTVLFSVIFGIFLIESVKSEVKRKEELQEMSDKLSQANDKLTQLDNAKSEFISIASHQLRTPLTAVKGFVSLLLEGSYGTVDAKQQEVLNKVYSSNDRLIHLVEDLLNVSRMESGRMQFTLAPTDMKAICKEVMDTFYIRAKDAGLYLEYKPTPDELPMVTIDGIKMKEVISNLVDNALKYCPKGGVTLRLDSGVSSQFVMQNTPKVGRFGSAPKISEKKVVRVTVSDTGIGIPQTELPYLFAKFSRGKDISRLNTGGTGLGLYVGKAIVEANGSRVWAESDGEGKGSRFIVEIPVEQDPEVIKKWS